MLITFSPVRCMTAAPAAHQPRTGALVRTLRRLLTALAMVAITHVPVQAKDLLIIGNSLTRHGPSPEIGWQGNWGMAASAADKDFVHQLAARLEQATQEKVAVSTVPGYPLEKNFLADTAPQISLPAKPDRHDYIVVEIGDNINFTTQQADLFEVRYDTLLAGLQKSLRPPGRLACLGKWWANDAVDDKIRRVCERHGGTFVPLASISTQPAAHADSERPFINKGVGEHPGDRGMAEIANRVFCALSQCSPRQVSGKPDIGVFYFPGWYSQSRYWKDIKGLPDSRSPNHPWPDREPLLGHYAEEDPKVAEQHIEWASQHGINFFAYDWYWDGKGTYLNHAIDNFKKAPNRGRMKFSLLWANHSDAPRNMAEFDAMLDFWVTNYLKHPDFYAINCKPVIFVFSNTQLEKSAQRFGSTAQLLLARADRKARKHGLAGLFFVATTNARPDDAIEDYLLRQGFSAYSGWNYVVSRDKRQTTDYGSMVETYLDFYSAARHTNGKLPYMVPASPGWDSRPWLGNQAITRTDPTPEKFRTMLDGARQTLQSGSGSIMNILMIEAWNEFGEGSFIEPTKKWGTDYLKVIKSIFSDS